MSRTADLISTMEMCERTGATFRQLDHWARTGVIVPAHGSTGSGNYRLWKDDDRRKVQALVALSAAAVNTRAGAPMMRVIGHGPATGPWHIDIDGVRISVHIHTTKRKAAIQP